MPKPTSTLLRDDAVGYAQMSKIMTNAGGFYAFVVTGLGKPMGLVAGFVAMRGTAGGTRDSDTAAIN